MKQQISIGLSDIICSSREKASVPTFLFARSDRIEKYGCLVHFTINSKKRPVLLQFFYTPQHTPSFF